MTTCNGQTENDYLSLELHAELVHPFAGKHNFLSHVPGFSMQFTHFSVTQNFMSGKEEFREVKEIAKKMCCSVFDVLSVKKYHQTSSGTASRILALTDICASYYDHDPEERTRCYWKDLKTISCGAGDVIILTFLVQGSVKERFETMKFKCKNVSDVLK